MYENTLIEDGSLFEVMLCVMYEFHFLPILNHIVVRTLSNIQLESLW